MREYNIKEVEHTVADFLTESRNYIRSERRWDKDQMTGITITYDDPALIIDVPAIIPRRRRVSSVLCENALQQDLQKFEKEHPDEFEKIQKSVASNTMIIFRHSYKNKAMSSGCDNIEAQRMIDLLFSAGYLKNGAEEYVRACIFSEINELGTDHTTIYILPKCEAKDYMENIICGR